MTSFQASVIGTAGSLLRAAGSIFGGEFSRAGNGAYEMQRAVGGPAHDSAFKAAVEECKGHFCQCRNCGLWVCPEVCWNGAVGQCKGCAPDFATQFQSAQAHAKVDAARSQLQQAAQKVDYVQNTDMSPGAVWQSPYAVPPPPPPGTQGAYQGPIAGALDAQDPYRSNAQPQGMPAGGYAPAPPPPGAGTTASALPCAVCKRTTGGVKFCEECGTPRSVACPKCNQPLHAGAKFCGTCGSHL